MRTGPLPRISGRVYVKFSRRELQRLRDRAEAEAKCASSTAWFRAFVDLSSALDRVDAMLARRSRG